LVVVVCLATIDCVAAGGLSAIGRGRCLIVVWRLDDDEALSRCDGDC